MTSKEALNNVCYVYGFDDNIVVLENSLNRLEELEKVLEIIKKKNVCLRVFRHYFCDKHNPYCNSYKYYLKKVDYFHYLDYKEKLTETEFNLLKKVLGWTYTSL